MLTVLKSRTASAFMILLAVAPLADLCPADRPLSKGTSTSIQEREVVPPRAPRTLSRGEIFQAIRKNLAQMGISGREELRPGDLNIQSAIPVLNDDVGLKIKSISFDPIRRETVFELWTSRQPQYLPFAVTTRRDPESLGLTSWQGWKLDAAGGELRSGNIAIGRGGSPARTKLPVLAKPGRPITLVMLGQNMRITTTVVPLQPGTKGQCILVRDTTTARVMTAEVVDEGLLRTTF
ncbi:MAG: flagella basal body P-ring formation protein FlgA [Acidobacteriota bacterium]|nr:flagella basal body P-ring formation protein FlgA [Acidobacteriota bacterium]